MFIGVTEALIGSGAFLSLALAVELVTPLYKVSWKSRLLGLQFTFAKAVGVALLVPVLNAGWLALGVQPLRLGSFANTLPGIVAGVVLAVALYDFLLYWNHRFMHRFFWAVHATHHSIRELSALNSYAHFAEKVSQFLIVALPLGLVRWEHTAIPFAISCVISLSEYWIHSPTTAQLNGARAVFVTPSFHRIHHSLEPQHFDKNFGILFSFWDRLFGTAFIPANDEWPDTGLEGHDEARSLWQYIVHPLIFLNVRLRPRSGVPEGIRDGSGLGS